MGRMKCLIALERQRKRPLPRFLEAYLRVPHVIKAWEVDLDLNSPDALVLDISCPGASPQAADAPGRVNSSQLAALKGLGTYFEGLLNPCDTYFGRLLAIDRHYFVNGTALNII